MAQALVGLARDPARAEGLGLAGRARQQRVFSIEAMTARICGASGRPRRARRAGAPAATAGSGHAVTNRSRTEAATRSRPGRLADRAGMGRMDHRADRRHERVRARRGGPGSRRAYRGRRQLGHRAVRGTELTGCTSGSTGRSLAAAVPCATPTCHGSPMGGRRPRLSARSTRSCRSCPPSAPPGMVRPLATECGRSSPWTMA